MSWPDDGEPRFIVASVSGFTISPAAGKISGHRRIADVYQVLDRAYAHKLVYEFHPGIEKGLLRSLRLRHRGEALCDDLNRQEAEGLFDRDLTEADVSPGVFV